ncbi:choice-of-anchor U domain-containing protein, partial [Streptomyces caeruleatus]
QDSGFNYGLGLMNFRLSCEDAGSSAQITQLYFDTSGSGFSARKYNPNTNAYFTIAGSTISSVTVGGKQTVSLSYMVKDGGDLDIDGAEDS